MALTVRPYRSSDYESLKQLYQSGSFGGQFDEDRDSEIRINAQIAESPRSILVAEDNGLITGTLSILQDKRFSWIMRFAVAKNQEGAVLALFQGAAEYLKEHGHKQVVVYAPTDHKELAEQYKKLGFIEGNMYRSFWTPLD